MEWKKTMPEFDSSLALITLPGVDQQHRAADQLISFFSPLLLLHFVSGYSAFHNLLALSLDLYLSLVKAFSL